MLIDFHTHAFADKIAERAVTKLCETAGIPSYTNGTEADLRKKLAEWGVDYGVMLPIATKPTQQKVINDWAAEISRGNLISFGTVHPDTPERELAEELERVKELGLKGVKIHPDYQGAFLFEEKMRPIYENCERLSLPLTIHMGYDPVSPLVRHAMPPHLAEISANYPKLKLIGAHMGGMYAWEEVYNYIAGCKNVWLDTSYTAGFIPREMMTVIIRKHGADKVFFGSDCPWHGVDTERKFIEELPLADSEKELIFHKNAAEFLEVKIILPSAARGFNF